MSQGIRFKVRAGSGFLSKAITLILLTAAILTNTASAEVDFDYLHGSDLGMGIGARAIGMSGAFTSVADDAWDEYASNLLSLAMVEADDDFSGAIDSKTMDVRFSLALAPLDGKRLLLGLTISTWIERPACVQPAVRTRHHRHRTNPSSMRPLIWAPSTEFPIQPVWVSCSKTLSGSLLRTNTANLPFQNTPQ